MMTVEEIMRDYDKFYRETVIPALQESQIKRFNWEAERAWLVYCWNVRMAQAGIFLYGR